MKPYASKGLISKRRFILINILLRKEKKFLAIIFVSFFLAGVFYQFPQIAMWLGFFFAAYSAVANDSIQTIGTFISSSLDKKVVGAVALHRPHIRGDRDHQLGGE